MNDFYQRKDISKSSIEFTITIPKDSFQQSYAALLKDQLKDTSIKGFRKGKVPANMVESQVGQGLKLEALEKLVPLYVTTLLQKENLEPIAPPEYKELPKIEDGKDIVVVITISVMPEFKLGNLKKVKVEKEEVKIEKKEIEDALEDIRKNNKTKATEINDDWAVEIGKVLKLKDVSNLKDLRKQLEAAMKAQKEHMLLHKNQEKALDDAIKLSNIEIPEPAVLYEAMERERTFRHDMQQRGVNVDEFVKMQGLTIEKMRELWKQDAKQALETDAFLKLYMKEKKMDISEEELNNRIAEIKKSAPKGTDTSVYDDENWRAYIKNVDLKQKAFESFIKDVFGEVHKD